MIQEVAPPIRTNPAVADRIDTQIDGDSPTSRDLSLWLKHLNESFGTVREEVDAVRRDSEYSWPSEGGEALRRELEKHAAGSTDLEHALHKAQHALDAFAEEIDSAREKVDLARFDARSHGLVVDDSFIYGPGKKPQTPTPVPGAERTFQVHPEYNRVSQQWEKRFDAYARAKSIVEEARAQEREAHEAFQNDVRLNVGFIEHFMHGLPWASVKLARALIAAPLIEARDMEEKAHYHQREYQKSLVRLRNTADPSHYFAAEKHARQHQRATRSAASNYRFNDLTKWVPNAAKEWMESYPLKGAGPLLRAIPGPNIALTGASVAMDISSGKPADRAVASGGMSLLGAAAGVELGLAVFGAGLSALPIVGTVGVAVGMAYGAGWLTDRYYGDTKDAVVDGVSSAGKAVTNAWDSLVS